MIKRLLATVFLIGLIGTTVHATDIYVAQTSAGANNGTNCANAYAYTDATHGTNGGQTVDQIPGNTIHICGTITGAAGDQVQLKEEAVFLATLSLFTSRFFGPPSGATTCMVN